ncbi:hypothetical protein L249_8713 [Ophiocordyceps polyrhachis-furcata BCC 54312]|uniref:Brix domain-containing protein n=1 Tax=Ophiocordyceps polyrhachis-furcata BCC 54312 TaxID=1330021 RepID=A0A367L6M5_9HYPO|nr:hypothetical protein L249_8713 [Ophiocordyceps polyrhachis-furcata BCC 54312]
MARKRTKKRTHAGANNPQPDTAVGHATMKSPKSMVIRIGAGDVGSSISQLTRDVRRVMEPGTASKLKERRGNRLKDYVVMCGPLGVTHLLLFSRSENGNTNLRIASTPRGPTLNFRLESYSLCRDVQRVQKHPRGGGKEFLTPPLLVMDSFSLPDAGAKSKVPKHLESLAATVFRSLFPPINPQATPLKTVRRVVLVSRETSSADDGTFIVNFRHYAITTRATDVSRPLRRISAAEKFMSTKSSRHSKVPNLGKLEDIADYMMAEGYATDATSGSEIDTDAEVEVLESAPKKVLSSKKARAAAAAAATAAATSKDEAEAEGGGGGGDEDRVERVGIKLVELGPRMRLRLTKVEESLCGGRVMWHEYVQKSMGEVRELEKRWEKRRQEKEARRREQKANLEKKRAAKKKEEKGGDDDDDDDDGGGGFGGEEDDEDDDDVVMSDEDDE